MPIKQEKNNGRRVGYFYEIRKRAEPSTGQVNQLETDILKEEISKREKVVPFVRVADEIVARGKEQGIEIGGRRLVYELNHDVLGRPEMFLGVNTSSLPLGEILKEDARITRGKIPPRQEPRIVWTDRLVVFEGKKRVAPYHSSGTVEEMEAEIKKLLKKIKK
jgi:hypothetical protein